MMERFRAFPDFASVNYVVTIAGTDYRLRFRYHPRCEGYYLDLLTPDEEEILVGTRIVIGWPLFQGHQDLDLPTGLMMALDIEGEGLELTEQDEFGDRVRLLYVPLDELKFTPSTARTVTVT